MNSDSENGSSESSIPAYNYLPGGLKEGTTTTPQQSRGTSPEILVQAIVEMGDEEETLRDLKKKRATAKAKYTILKQAILGSLQNSDIPASRVTTSEKEFQDAFEKLSDAHSQYVGARYLDEEDLEPTDANIYGCSNHRAPRGRNRLEKMV